MKKSFIIGNVLLVIGSIILAAGVIAAPTSNLVTADIFNNYHLLAIGLGLALLLIGALTLILEYVITFTNAKLSVKKDVKEVKAEPETKAVEVKVEPVKTETKTKSAVKTTKPTAKTATKTTKK